MNSQIILAQNINMDKQYTNVLSYSESQMLTLCRENQVASANNYSFLRATGTILVEFSYAQCLQANYIAFQNPDYSNKWFFAFIDDVIYKGDRNCELKFTVDAWSTWFDKWQKKTCFINRQHTNNDTIGANTVPENIDVGEVKEESHTIHTDLAQNYYYMVMSSYNPATKQDFAGAGKINANIFGSFVFAFESSNVGVVSLRHFLQATNQDGKIEGVESLFIAPKVLIDNIGKRSQESTYEGATYSFYIIESNSDSSNDSIELPFTVDRITSFNDFTPKNNKCFVYPYNYILVSNNIGNQNIYKYEDFYNSDVIGFAIQMALSIGVSCRLVPRGYKNIDYNYDESLPLAKYPTGSWSTDAFTNWLTANAVNIGTEIIGTGVGVATGNVATVSGNISNLIGQFYSASLLPNIKGGQNTGDVNFSSKSNTFNIYNMRAKTEYMRIIDDYFTRFGYAVKRLETPNIIGRRYWNYVEIGSSEEIGYGNVPSKYMDIINNACRRGVTIWHNHENIGNYSLSNTII